MSKKGSDKSGRKDTIHKGSDRNSSTLIVITITPEDIGKNFPLRGGVFPNLNKVESCKLVSLIYVIGQKCRLTQEQLDIFTGRGVYRKNDKLVEIYDASYEVVKLTEDVIMTGSLNDLFTEYCGKEVLVQICPPLGIVNTQWEAGAHAFLRDCGYEVVLTYEPEFSHREELPDLGDDDEVDPATRAEFIKAQRRELGLDAREDVTLQKEANQGHGQSGLVCPIVQQEYNPLPATAGDKHMIQNNFIEGASTESQQLKLRLIELSNTARHGTAMYYLNIDRMADELIRRGLERDSIESFLEEQVNHLLIEGLHESGNYEASHSIGRGDLTGTEIVERICHRLQTTDEISSRLESILAISKHTSNFLMSNQPYKFGDMAVSTTYVPSVEEDNSTPDIKTTKKKDQESTPSSGKTINWSAFKKKN